MVASAARVPRRSRRTLSAATSERAQAHDHLPRRATLLFAAWAFKIGDSMKVVLAGFPRVGKTTVFQSLTGLADSTAARGAAARGIIRVPDARVDELSKIYRPRKTTYATVVFVDVQPPEAGSLDKATVLSAPLRAELKDADAVAAVVRGFPDPYSGAAAEPETRVRALRRGARVHRSRRARQAPRAAQQGRQEGSRASRARASGQRPRQRRTAAYARHAARGSENPLRLSADLAGAVARGAEPVRRGGRCAVAARRSSSSSNDTAAIAWRWLGASSARSRSSLPRIRRRFSAMRASSTRPVTASCRRPTASSI